MTAEVATSLQQVTAKEKAQIIETFVSDDILLGTICKNGGCSTSYEGPQTDEIICIYHSGMPVFHEGLKFWSCCQRKTTDFNTFLNQVGCERGTHSWRKNVRKLL